MYKYPVLEFYIVMDIQYLAGTAVPHNNLSHF